MGDFVLTGGEIPAMAIVDAVSRLIPGVLGDDICFTDESHWNGLLEYPQYSRPDEWHGLSVPEVLRSGDHAKVARWQKKGAICGRCTAGRICFTSASRIKRGPSVNLSRNWRRRTMRSEIETLKTWITESDNIVFFGGAGVSTESGIPDFRSTDGLYHQKFEYPPETILSHTFSIKIRSIFSASTVKKCSRSTISRTRRIKSLPRSNRRANSAPLSRRTSTACTRKRAAKPSLNCTAPSTATTVKNAANSIRRSISGIQTAFRAAPAAVRIKPDVVLYEESLDQKVIEGAVRAIADADVLIVGGTSLTVYPAAGLIRYYRGNKLVLINRDETPYDGYANLIFRDPIGKVLGAV